MPLKGQIFPTKGGIGRPTEDKPKTQFQSQMMQHEPVFATGARFRDAQTGTELVFITKSDNGRYVMLNEDSSSILWYDRREFA
jgi:hypothetical protein